MDESNEMPLMAIKWLTDSSSVSVCYLQPRLQISAKHNV